MLEEMALAEDDGGKLDGGELETEASCRRSGLEMEGELEMEGSWRWRASWRWR